MSFYEEGGGGGDGADSSSGADAAHTARNLKTFLLVQSIKTLQYYWSEYHDTDKAHYLEKFLHGRDLGQMGWDGFLSELMQAEPEEMTVRKVAQRPLGGSGSNPYLNKQRHAHEYTILLEPLEITKRIMTVREQVAREWSDDLKLVERENDEILRHHVDTLSMDASASDIGRQRIFDHDPFGTTATPFRGGNYRELLKMVTKVGVRRYEAELRQNGHRYHQNWLERFMVKGGSGVYGNELCEAMLNGPMLMINPRISGGGDKPRVIEPTQIARGVMARRAAAADEFCTILASIPTDHLRLKAAMLETQLASTANVLATPQRDAITGTDFL